MFSSGPLIFLFETELSEISASLPKPCGLSGKGLIENVMTMGDKRWLNEIGLHPWEKVGGSLVDVNRRRSYGDDDDDDGGGAGIESLARRVLTVFCSVLFSYFFWKKISHDKQGLRILSSRLSWFVTSFSYLF